MSSRLGVHALDLATRKLWRATGRQVDLDGDDSWLSTLRATGDFVFSGCYSARSLPAADRPSVHVSFPLESGNVQVFLRPYAEDGALVLRTDHVLKLWGATAVRLHYKLEPARQKRRYLGT